MRERSALESEIYIESGRQMLCLQETKMETMSYSIMCSLWGCGHVNLCCLDSRGHPVVFFSCGIGGWCRKIDGCG
jgi:hypothetical protein